MEPVEINAGTWYLRALRADERVSDVPALRDLGVDDPDVYVASRNAAWADESAFTWAVCEPTTGELVAGVGVRVSSATLHGRGRHGYEPALGAAAGPGTCT